MPVEAPDDEDGPVKEENEDEKFEADLLRALQQSSDEEDDDESGSEDDEDGENDDEDQEGGSDSESASGSGSDDDEDDEEYSGAKKLVDDEIRQLESAGGISVVNDGVATISKRRERGLLVEIV